METEPISEFSRRVIEEWLPAFCNDPKRNFGIGGFKSSSIRITELDAINCMRAIDSGLIRDDGGGRFRADRSAAFEVMFWEGQRSIIPRPITLWIEPIITMASAGRLHHEFGWPKDCIGLQSKHWGFDLVAYCEKHNEQEYIFAEVKKSKPEIHALMDDLLFLSSQSITKNETVRNTKINSRKKWEELLLRKPKVLWLIGPNGYGYIFSVAYPANDSAVLAESTAAVLEYEN
jgi:hypothetical protein